MIASPAARAEGQVRRETARCACRSGVAAARTVPAVHPASAPGRAPRCSPGRARCFRSVSCFGSKIVMLMPRAWPLRMAALRMVSSSCQREAARQAIADRRHDRIVQHVDVEVDPEAVRRPHGTDARSRRAPLRRRRRGAPPPGPARRSSAAAAGCRTRAPARRRADRAPRHRRRAPADAGLRCW